jgi:Protein of unknown function (DUF1018)
MNHIKAIHTVKTKMAMLDGDYRALLRELTKSPMHREGLDSCSAMNPVQLAKVRLHFDGLANKMGVARAKSPKPPNNDNFQVSKIKSLWTELGQLGALKDISDKGLCQFAKNQSASAASDIRFLTIKERSNIIESLKSWIRREEAKKAL